MNDVTLLWTTTVLSEKLNISLRPSKSVGQTQLDVLRDVVVQTFLFDIRPVSLVVQVGTKISQLSNPIHGQKIKENFFPTGSREDRSQRERHLIEKNRCLSEFMLNFFEGSLTRFARCYVLTCLYLYIISFQFLCVCCYCCCYYFLSIYLYLKGLFGLEAANSGFG